MWAQLITQGNETVSVERWKLPLWVPAAQGSRGAVLGTECCGLRPRGPAGAWGASGRGAALTTALLPAWLNPSLLPPRAPWQI